MPGVRAGRSRPGVDRDVPPDPRRGCRRRPDRVTREGILCPRVRKAKRAHLQTNALIEIPFSQELARLWAASPAAGMYMIRRIRHQQSIVSEPDLAEPRVTNALQPLAEPIHVMMNPPARELLHLQVHQRARETLELYRSHDAAIALVRGKPARGG